MTNSFVNLLITIPLSDPQINHHTLHRERVCVFSTQAAGRRPYSPPSPTTTLLGAVSHSVSKKTLLVLLSAHIITQHWHSPTDTHCPKASIR